MISDQNIRHIRQLIRHNVLVNLLKLIELEPTLVNILYNRFGS